MVKVLSTPKSFQDKQALVKRFGIRGGTLVVVICYAFAVFWEVNRSQDDTTASPLRRVSLDNDTFILSLRSLLGPAIVVSLYILGVAMHRLNTPQDIDANAFVNKLYKIRWSNPALPCLYTFVVQRLSLVYVGWLFQWLVSCL